MQSAPLDQFLTANFSPSYQSGESTVNPYDEWAFVDAIGRHPSSQDELTHWQAQQILGGMDPQAFFNKNRPNADFSYNPSTGMVGYKSDAENSGGGLDAFMNSFTAPAVLGGALLGGVGAFSDLASGFNSIPDAGNFVGDLPVDPAIGGTWTGAPEFAPLEGGLDPMTTDLGGFGSSGIDSIGLDPMTTDLGGFGSTGIDAAPSYNYDQFLNDIGIDPASTQFQGGTMTNAEIANSIGLPSGLPSVPNIPPVSSPGGSNQTSGTQTPNAQTPNTQSGGLNTTIQQLLNGNGSLSDVLGGLTLGQVLGGGAGILGLLGNAQANNAAQQQSQATAQANAARKAFLDNPLASPNSMPSSAQSIFGPNANLNRQVNPYQGDYSKYGQVGQPTGHQWFTQQAAKGGLSMAHGESMQRHEPLVQGPGGGQDDTIPARLSDSEFVVDSDVVTALGDGSAKEGARKLDLLRERVRSHKRSAPAHKIPPKAKSIGKYVPEMKKYGV